MEEVLFFFECSSLSFFEDRSRILHKRTQNILAPRGLRIKLSGFRQETLTTVVFSSDRKRLKKMFFTFLLLVLLGFVPELPAESCAEIRASEGEDAVSGNYWFDSINPGEVVRARCDMSTLGNYTLEVLPRLIIF